MGCCGGRKLLQQGRQLQGQSVASAAQQTHAAPAMQSSATGAGRREFLRQAPRQSGQTPTSRKAVGKQAAQSHGA